MNNTNEDVTRQILNLESDPIMSLRRTTKDKPFFMVFQENGQPPRHTHSTFPIAQSESQRLANINPGRKFFILQAVAVSQAEITPVRTERMID